MLLLFESYCADMIRWDGEQESLSATLYQARPDVFPVSASPPIPAETPDSNEENLAVNCY